MKSNKMFLTSLVLGSMMTLSAQAQFTPGTSPVAGPVTQTPGGQPITVTGNNNTVIVGNAANPPQFGSINPNYYYQWCDQVVEILTTQARFASGLYAHQRYSEAKAIMVAAFQKALGAAQLPGTFRPYTYQELVRSLDLFATLEASPSASQSQHDNLIAYVALNRVDYVIRVKNELDRAYVIPYAGSCHNGCGGGFGAAQLQAYQLKLAQIAGQQLQAVLGYSALPMGEWVYPAVDGGTFFTIMSKTAQWAAEDLSINLFNTAFSCAIIELGNVGPEAIQYQSFGGDRMAVRYIYEKVRVIAKTIQRSPYGCNGFPYNDAFNPGRGDTDVNVNVNVQVNNDSDEDANDGGGNDEQDGGGNGRHHKK